MNSLSQRDGVTVPVDLLVGRCKLGDEQVQQKQVREHQVEEPKDD